jgi:hypothetical protein
MDQDGLSIALALVAFAILCSGLRSGRVDIQFFHAARAHKPIAYWACMVVLLLVGIEASRRAIFIGCVEC